MAGAGASSSGRVQRLCRNIRRRAVKSIDPAGRLREYRFPSGVSDAESVPIQNPARDRSSRLRFAVRYGSHCASDAGWRRRHDLCGREDRIRARSGRAGPRIGRKRLRSRRGPRFGEGTGVRSVLRVPRHRVRELRGRRLPCASGHLASPGNTLLRTAAGPSRVHAPGRASGRPPSRHAAGDAAPRAPGVHTPRAAVHSARTAAVHPAGTGPDAAAAADSAGTGPDAAADAGLDLPASWPMVRGERPRRRKTRWFQNCSGPLGGEKP